MTTGRPEIAATCFPVTRVHPFDPPTGLTRQEGEDAMRPLQFPDGHIGWLITGARLGREILANPKFSIDPQLTHSPVDDPQKYETLRSKILTNSEFRAGFFMLMDPPEHSRLRRMLTGHFTVRRIRQYESRIQLIVNDRLDAMGTMGAPLDLMEVFTAPVALGTQCALLGVPASEGELFGAMVAATTDPESSAQLVVDAYEELHRYVADVLTEKRRHPGEDLLSELAVSGELTESEIVGIARLLFFAGHGTTTSMLTLSTFALLSHRHEWRKICSEPATLHTAIEELLRYLGIFQTGILRTATEDVDIGGSLITAGQTVAVAVNAANRDPEVFPQSNILDTSAKANGHLAFGHGVHQCLGQHLARLEMRVGIGGLAKRYPTLRLAATARDIPLRRGDQTIHNVRRLPVAW
jgi:cytochrome P450